MFLKRLQLQIISNQTLNKKAHCYNSTPTIKNKPFTIKINLMTNLNQNSETNNTLLLQGFKEKAIRAHSWTSFSPEKRGETMVNQYSAQLAEDLEELKAQNIDSETLAAYEQRYKSLFGAWLNAKSNCISSMITGPARFPIHKAEKANRSEENHYNIFQQWREKAKKAIIKKLQPEKTYNSEIDRYKQELEGMRKNHELMKEGNIAIKKAHKEKTDISQYLIDTFGIQPHMIDWTMKFGFGLQNNNANMKRVEARIKELEAKEQNRQNEPEKEFLFNGGKVIMNYEADRIQIKHDTKPNQDVITLMKKNAFKWSPLNQVWQRQMTRNAIYTTKQLLKNI